MSRTAFVVVTAMAVAYYCNSSDDKPSAAPTPEQPHMPTEIDAWVMTKELVRRNLKSPSTADFGSLFRDYQDPKAACVALGGREWRCSGWVDSQNGFGAMMRTEFVAVVANVEGDTWQMMELTTE